TALCTTVSAARLSARRCCDPSRAPAARRDSMSQERDRRARKQLGVALAVRRDGAPAGEDTVVAGEVRGTDATAAPTVADTAGRGAGAPTLRRRPGLGPRPGKASTVSRYPLIILIAVAAVDQGDRALLSAVFPLIKQEFHLSDTALGTLSSAFTVLG